MSNWSEMVDFYYSKNPVIVYTAFRPPFIDREAAGVFLSSEKELRNNNWKVGSDTPEGRITRIVRNPSREEVEDALVLEEMNAEIARNI